MDRNNFIKALLAFVFSITFAVIFFHPTRKEILIISSYRSWYCPVSKLPEDTGALTYLLNLENKKIPMLRLGNGCFTPIGNKILPKLDKANLIIVGRGKSFYEMIRDFTVNE